MTRINFNLITQFIIVETYGNIINCASIKVYSYNAFSTVSTPNALLFLKFHLLLRVLLYVHSYMSLSIFFIFSRYNGRSNHKEEVEVAKRLLESTIKINNANRVAQQGHHEKAGYITSNCNFFAICNLKTSTYARIYKHINIS